MLPYKWDIWLFQGQKDRNKSFRSTLSNTRASLSNINILPLLNFQLHPISQRWQRHNEGLYLTRGEFGTSFTYTTFSRETPAVPRAARQSRYQQVWSPAESEPNFFPVSHFLVAWFGNGYPRCAVLPLGQPATRSGFPRGIWPWKSLPTSPNAVTAAALGGVSPVTENGATRSPKACGNTNKSHALPLNGQSLEIFIFY